MDIPIVWFKIRSNPKGRSIDKNAWLIWLT